MDPRSWNWRRRSSGNAFMSDKPTDSSCRYEEQIQKLHTEKSEVERDNRMLIEKLSFALADCNAKDNVVKEQVKIAEEAITGWENAETEAIFLKQKLDQVLQQKAACDERICQLDAALKECVQQVRMVREEGDIRGNGAFIKKSGEFEKIRIALEEKLTDVCKKIRILDAENTQLSKVLTQKDKMIENLSKQRDLTQAESSGLKLKVESSEKETASLKYEVLVLEKALELRNDEKEFSRRMADLAQKQHQESVKKIAKLETECQRLHLLAGKRFPAPAYPKMRTEISMPGRNLVETRGRKSNPSVTSSVQYCYGVTPEAQDKRIRLLTEQLHDVEQKNRILENSLNRKSRELEFSRSMYARTASRLSRAEGQTTTKPGQYLAFLQEHSPAHPSDVDIDDKASYDESWASALIYELEHFKNERQSEAPSQGTSSINLIDDFAEMEKLAVVSVDYPAGSSRHSFEDNNAKIGTSGSLCGVNSDSEPGRLGNLLKMLLEYSHVLQRDPHEVLEDMRVVLGHNHNSQQTVAAFGKQGSTHREKSLDRVASESGNNVSNEKKSSQIFNSNLKVSISKILELLEGINLQHQEDCVAESFPGEENHLLSYKSSGYMVRVFQWKTEDLSSILQKFVQTCNDLLNGAADLEQFAQQVASNLEWIMSHCFSFRDVSSMKDAIRSHLDWDELSESEVESGYVNLCSECSCRRVEDMQPICMVSLLDGQNSSTEVEVLQSPRKGLKKTNAGHLTKKRLPLNMECGSRSTEGHSLKLQLQQSTSMIKDVQLEIETVKQSKSIVENHIQKKMKDGIELECKNDASSRMEEACPDRDVQLKHMTSKDVPNGNNWQKLLRNDWEIVAASEKLAECQETIVNLGKQLRALASPNDAAPFNNAISTPPRPIVPSILTPGKSVGMRTSLLEKILAEDSDPLGVSSRTGKVAQNGNGNNAANTNCIINPEDCAKIAVASMQIAPCKKANKSFFKKLFCRRKKGRRNEVPFSKAGANIDF